MTTNPFELHDRLARDYGVHEDNPLIDGQAYHAVERESVQLTDPRLAKVTRLRLLSDRGLPFWDISYTHGVLKDGTPVRIEWPEGGFHPSKRELKRSIVNECKKHGIFAKGLGLLDDGTYSKLQ